MGKFQHSRTKALPRCPIIAPCAALLRPVQPSFATNAGSHMLQWPVGSVGHAVVRMIAESTVTGGINWVTASLSFEDHPSKLRQHTSSPPDKLHHCQSCDRRFATARLATCHHATSYKGTQRSRNSCKEKSTNNRSVPPKNQNHYKLP